MVGNIIPASGLSGSGSVFYPVSASTFDGTTAFLAISGVTGSTTGLGSFSGWCKLASAANGQIAPIAEALGNSGTNQIQIYKDTDDKIHVDQNGNGTLFKFTSVNTYTSASGWFHLAISWSTNFSSGNKLSNLYINGISDKVITIDGAAFTLVLGTYVAQVGKQPSGLGSVFYPGSLSQLYFNPGVYIDFSVLANLRQFITSTRRPDFFGNNGSIPTGSSPPFYLKGSGTGFNINSGSAGNFATTGTLTTPTTTPSAP